MHIKECRALNFSVVLIQHRYGYLIHVNALKTYIHVQDTQNIIIQMINISNFNDIKHFSWTFSSPRLAL